MKLVTLLTLLCLAIFSTTTLASGGGGYGNNSHRAKMEAKNKYNRGKVTFFNKLACESCPVNKASLNKTTAEQIAKDLKNREKLSSDLTAKERDAVIYYLSERY